MSKVTIEFHPNGYVIFSNGKNKILPTGYPNFPYDVKEVDSFVALDLMWMYEISNEINKYYGIDVLCSQIEDFGVPTFEQVDMILDFIDRHKFTVLSCIGGKGRTGTILAIWCGINGVENPIEFVRVNYNKKAIETKEQEEFVHKYLKSRIIG